MPSEDRSRLHPSRLRGWLSEREPATLLALLLVACAVWAFVEIADEVLEGETQAVDERLLLALRSAADPHDPLGPSWVEELGRDITGLGGVGVLTLLTVASAGFLVLQRKAHLALYLVAAVASGALASQLLKLGFDRPRPDLVPHGQVVYTSSFPSGHSMLSAVAFLTLGALLASAQSSRRMKAYLLGLAIVFATAVGVSRVYLGVHWPSDVLGGWTAGAGWALLCWSIARYLQRRGKLE
jgi:undecaprenyl-diphosphatase